MEILAEQKFLLISPKKVRPVAAMIKKLKPSQAVEALPFVDKKAGLILKKVIVSALANAKAKGASETDLIFKEIQIGEGPRLKRGMAGAHGRWKPYKRRMSHIRVVLETTKSEIQSTKSQTNKNVENSKPKTEEPNQAKKGSK